MTTNYAAHGSRNYASTTMAGCEAAGEPVFPLRAQDLLAGPTVRFWADLLESNNGDPLMVREARAIADGMEDWPTKKLPD